MAAIFEVTLFSAVELLSKNGKVCVKNEQVCKNVEIIIPIL